MSIDGDERRATNAEVPGRSAGSSMTISQLLGGSLTCGNRSSLSNSGQRGVLVSHTLTE
jgi:hypothetical protein